VHDLMIHDHSESMMHFILNYITHTVSLLNMENLNYTLQKLALPRVKPNGGIQFHNATKRLLSQKHNIVSPILACHMN
jgi:hypothetical protein